MVLSPLCPGVLLLAAALSAAPRPGATSWYLGRQARTTLDGRMPYGTDECAVKREILEGGARIRETTTQPGHSPSSPPSTRILELRRRGRTLVYDAVEDGGAFSGTWTFESAALEAWQCEMKRRAGGSLSGRGEITGGTYRTRYALEGHGLDMLLTSTCRSATSNEYAQSLASMRPRPGSE